MFGERTYASERRATGMKLHGGAGNDVTPVALVNVTMERPVKRTDIVPRER